MTDAALYRDRWTALIDHLRTLKSYEWDYAHIVSVKRGDFRPLTPEQALEPPCGTTCCALGWMPAVAREDWAWSHVEVWDGPRLTVIGPSGSAACVYDDLAEWFGASPEFIVHIFESMPSVLRACFEDEYILTHHVTSAVMANTLAIIRDHDIDGYTDLRTRLREMTAKQRAEFLDRPVHEDDK